MIHEINLDKYNVKLEPDDGEEKIIDLANNKSRPANPEEFVRQKFMKFMHKKLDIPYTAMLSEESIAHDVHGNLDRMDICVQRETNYGEKKVMVVECKAHHVPLTEEVYNQAKRYAEAENVPVIIITNGHEYDCIKRNSDNTYEDIPKLPTYEELAKYEDIKTIPIEEYSYERWSYGDLHREDVLEIERGLFNHIVPETERDTAIHSLNIAECFLDVSHKIEDLPLRTYEFVKDEGIFKRKVGNPSDNFVATCRILEIKDKNGNCKHFGFSVVINSNHPSLYVSTYLDNCFHNALQFNLDNNMVIDGNKLHFYHEYKTNLNQKELKKYVRSKKFFEEDENENIILGDVEVSGLLYCDNPEMKNFIANLIEYCIIREEYKLADKQKKEANKGEQ